MEKIRRSKKFALLVGCNYPNAVDEVMKLRGCHNDVVHIRTTLITKLGFDPNLVELLTDAPGPGSITMPTGANIKKALNRMIKQARAGDVLFFHFSGHGTIFPSSIGSSNKIEAIMGCDYNPITSVDFRQLVDRVPKGATFTIMSDSCHSGGLIDKEPVRIGPGLQPLRDEKTTIVEVCPGKAKIIPYGSLLQKLSSLTGLNNPDIGAHMLQMFGPDASLLFSLPPDSLPEALKPDQGILLSGCQSDEYSTETPDSTTGEVNGVFSKAVRISLNENHGLSLSNNKIILMARSSLQRQGRYEQHPCLYCSEKNASAIFLHNTGRP